MIRSVSILVLLAAVSVAAADPCKSGPQPNQRQVLILKFVFDFSNQEAATVLDKTEGAIKSLQHRALASLQKQMK